MKSVAFIAAILLSAVCYADTRSLAVAKMNAAYSAYDAADYVYAIAFVHKSTCDNLRTSINPLYYDAYTANLFDAITYADAQLYGGQLYYDQAVEQKDGAEGTLSYGNSVFGMGLEHLNAGDLIAATGNEPETVAAAEAQWQYALDCFTWAEGAFVCSAETFTAANEDFEEAYEYWWDVKSSLQDALNNQ